MEILNGLTIIDDGKSAVIKLDGKEIKGVTEYMLKRSSENNGVANLMINMNVVIEKIETVSVKNEVNK